MSSDPCKQTVRHAQSTVPARLTACLPTKTPGKRESQSKILVFKYRGTRRQLPLSREFLAFSSTVCCILQKWSTAVDEYNNTKDRCWIQNKKHRNIFFKRKWCVFRIKKSFEIIDKKVKVPALEFKGCPIWICRAKYRSRQTGVRVHMSTLPSKQEVLRRCWPNAGPTS